MSDKPSHNVDPKEVFKKVLEADTQVEKPKAKQSAAAVEHEKAVIAEAQRRADLKDSLN